MGKRTPVVVTEWIQSDLLVGGGGNAEEQD